VRRQTLGLEVSTSRSPPKDTVAPERPDDKKEADSELGEQQQKEMETMLDIIAAAVPTKEGQHVPPSSTCEGSSSKKDAPPISTCEDSNSKKDASDAVHDAVQAEKQPAPPVRPTVSTDVATWELEKALQFRDVKQLSAAYETAMRSNVNPALLEKARTSIEQLQEKSGEQEEVASGMPPAKRQKKDSAVEQVAAPSEGARDEASPKKVVPREPSRSRSRDRNVGYI